MTGSMIPYSFVPGTKAKASEVNANFLSLANVITENQTSLSGSIQNLQEQTGSILTTLAQKANISDLQTIFPVTETNTNLNTYLTPGHYIFDVAHKPSNPPVGKGGLLIVTGTNDIFIKQIWYGDKENCPVYTRNYSNESWSTWIAGSGIYSQANPGYLKTPSGLIIQWGSGSSTTVTYPVAFPKKAFPAVSKYGANGNYERSDSGITAQALTGFTFTSYGICSSIYWIAVGY